MMISNGWHCLWVTWHFFIIWPYFSYLFMFYLSKKRLSGIVKFFLLSFNNISQFTKVNVSKYHVFRDQCMEELHIRICFYFISFPNSHIFSNPVRTWSAMNINCFKRLMQLFVAYHLHVVRTVFIQLSTLCDVVEVAVGFWYDLFNSLTLVQKKSSIKLPITINRVPWLKRSCNVFKFDITWSKTCSYWCSIEFWKFS